MNATPLNKRCGYFLKNGLSFSSSRIRSEIEIPGHRGYDGKQADLIGLQIECPFVQVTLVAEVDEIRVHSVVNVVESEGPTRFYANVAVFFLFL